MFSTLLCSRGWGDRAAPTSQLEQGLDQFFLPAEPTQIFAGVWLGQGSNQAYLGVAAVPGRGCGCWGGGPEPGCAKSCPGGGTEIRVKAKGILYKSGAIAPNIMGILLV